MAVRKTKDGMRIIKQRFGIDPRTDVNVQAFAEDFRIAQMVYDARQAAGMTQKQLADAIDTTESVIVELEQANYEGESLSVLRRIADALHMKLRVELIPVESE
jgi:ribosome-binding protein aMBF1 (putative translation factor)